MSSLQAGPRKDKEAIGIPAGLLSKKLSKGSILIPKKVMLGKLPCRSEPLLLQIFAPRTLFNTEIVSPSL